MAPEWPLRYTGSTMSTPIRITPRAMQIVKEEQARIARECGIEPRFNRVLELLVEAGLAAVLAKAKESR